MILQFCPETQNNLCTKESKDLKPSLNRPLDIPSQKNSKEDNRESHPFGEEGMNFYMPKPIDENLEFKKYQNPHC